MAGEEELPTRVVYPAMTPEQLHQQDKRRKECDRERRIQEVWIDVRMDALRRQGIKTP